MRAGEIRVLILGGYGTFGGRLAQLLADERRLTLIIAGRSRAKAEAFCAGLPAVAVTVPAAFDRDGDVEPQLRALAPNVVVDVTGPFQGYGADPYRVVKAALALGVNYLDLSDGADFVKGIAQFDHEARARDVFVLSGVSSFPVLTAAVVRSLAQGMTRVESVIAGIAPSPFANVGLNVIRAIASYAGKPVTLLRDGHLAIGHGLLDTLRYTIAPPGRLPLYPVRFSLVDVPDLKLLPNLWPDLRSVWIGAGPVPEIWHRLLNAVAWLIRLRVLPSLAPFAGLMHGAVKFLSWGEHRGGMFVAVEGLGPDEQRVACSWHLLAEGDDGPLIPSMAAAAVIRNCLADRRPPAGARAATGELELADYEPQFSKRKITTGRRQSPTSCGLPLYRRLLGEAWEQLPEPLRVMHDLQTGLTAAGVATVERGRGWPARMAAWLVGFPQAGSDVPVTVRFRARDGKEYWQRTFGDRRFGSVQKQGRAGSEGLLCERFGPLVAGLALVLEKDRLRLVVRRWSVFGIPMPLALAPTGNSYESAENGRFNFHVEIRHPFTGLIVAYRGWLLPQR